MSLFFFSHTALSSVHVSQSLHFQTTLQGKESDPRSSTCCDFLCVHIYTHITYSSSNSNPEFLSNSLKSCKVQGEMGSSCHSSAFPLSSFSTLWACPELSRGSPGAEVWQELWRLQPIPGSWSTRWHPSIQLFRACTALCSPSFPNTGTWILVRSKMGIFHSLRGNVS